MNRVFDLQASSEKAILVNVSPDKFGEKVFTELGRLADTAGYVVVGSIFQRRDIIDKTYCIGKGRLEDLKSLTSQLCADVVIFDNDLSGSRFNNLEEYLQIKVIDRRELILEIFAARAQSSEGKLQIELARRKNALPRLTGRGISLSRQGGGGAGGGGARRGGGEQLLELDRRTLRREIDELAKRIDKLSQERALRREHRQKNLAKTVAIVGYTNAGKSTLMNAFTKAGVNAEDKLFATLDPISRKIWVDIDKEFLLTDTVGFISRLPHDLIDAFKSTLEEAKYADLLLHVVDGASENSVLEYDTVCDTLRSIGVSDATPRIVVVNKSDKGIIATIPSTENIVIISAKMGYGLDTLKEHVCEMIFPSLPVDHQNENKQIDEIEMI
jgi:GTP-binding protein HflX